MIALERPAYDQFEKLWRRQLVQGVGEVGRSASDSRHTNLASDSVARHNNRDER
jgi:hypothetical protein